MRPRFRTCCLFGSLVLGASGAVRADQIWLQDGTVREGIIIEDGQDRLVIEVKRDGVVRAERIARSDVQRVVWGTVPPAETLAAKPETTADELARRARVAELTGTARAHYDFATWCVEKNRHAEAVKAFQTAAKMDPALAVDALYRAARSLVKLDQVDQAKRLLTELVHNNPEHHQAAILLGRLDADNAARVATLVSLAVERFNKGEHARSISTLRRLGNLKDPAQLADAERRLRSLTGLTIAEFIVENQFRAGCPTCGKALRTGLVNCPQCKGTGTVSRDRDSRVDSTGSREVPGGGPLSNDSEVCKTCRGFTYIICPRCGGAGYDFGVIGPIEKDAMRARLESEIEQAWKKEVEPLLAREKELNAPLAEDILLKAKRLQYFLGVLQSLVDSADEERTEAIRERRRLVDNLVDQAEAVYAKRSLEGLNETDRIQLEKLLLDDDTLVREIAGQAANPPDAGVPSDQPSSARSGDPDPVGRGADRP